MTSPLRDRIKAAYDDLDCPHSDHYPINRDGDYVTVPCGDCVADAVLAVTPAVAPAAGQRDRVDLLAARLVDTEVARLEAVRDGNRPLHNDLATMNRDAVGEAAVNDLRSLVLRWALDRGKAAYEAREATR